MLRRAEDSQNIVAAGGNSAGPLRLDPRGQDAYIRGRAAGLTNKEFELLRILVENCGKIVSREELVSAVWGQELDPESKTLRVHVYRLRKKLDAAGKLGKYVKTKRDRGYLLSPEIRQAE